MLIQPIEKLTKKEFLDHTLERAKVGAPVIIISYFLARWTTFGLLGSIEDVPFVWSSHFGFEWVSLSIWALFAGWVYSFAATVLKSGKKGSARRAAK